MRIVSWNIRHGGGARIGPICKGLLRLRPDVIVLGEIRGTAPSGQLRSDLASHGFLSQFSTAPTPRTNSVLVASRLPCHEIHPVPEFAQEAYRVVQARIGALRLIAVYLPAVGKTLRPVFTRLLEIAPRWLQSPTVIAGDFNTGLNAHDTEGMPFSCSREMTALLSTGWIDAWRHRHRARSEYTWYSAAGNGFRIDHALLTPGLTAALRSVYYDHSLRTASISDHSALVLDLAS